jgi:hypothetical protein
MPEYRKIFGKVLNEWKIPDTKRNPDDVKIDSEVDAEPFNTQPNDVNVGFRNNNILRDRQKLDDIIRDVDNIIDILPTLSEKLAFLERSFDGIGKSSKTVAAVNQKLNEMIGELQGYIIALPAQKDEQEAEMAPDQIGEALSPPIVFKKGETKCGRCRGTGGHRYNVDPTGEREWDVCEDCKGSGKAPKKG